MGRRAGILARAQEREGIESLKSRFDFVESSNMVCDAIAIKDGKVFLIEFKFGEQHLKEAQEIAMTTTSPGTYILIGKD